MTAPRIENLTESIAVDAVSALGELEGAAFCARLARAGDDLVEALIALYGAQATPALLERVVGVALAGATARCPALRLRDRLREVDDDWYLGACQIGYATYVDRFCGTLAALPGHLDYLQELGVTYLHLMPLLRPREGESDGGYAVADYRELDPRLGTIADLEAVAAALHERGMNLCVDLVINHTAAEHAWARAAVAGDRRMRARYLTFPDRTVPDLYERTLPEVFPDTAPGSFTDEPAMGRVVWTTFNTWQWDLDYTSPDTFAAMFEEMVSVANRGVDVLRLDAVPFTWKVMGTDCQNQYGAHRLLQAFRALMRVTAPSVVFKAEAIVPAKLLLPYLGGHDAFRPECEIAYNNQLMVMLWSAAASRDANLMVRALRGVGTPPLGTTWVNYLRCHDDIGWAVSDDDAAAAGIDGAAHRRFLADFYADRFTGSHAKGVDFQHNPETGDVRTSGMAAALAGIDQARIDGDELALAGAIRRLVLLYSVVYAYGGIPLIWMGDEIALANDARWQDDPLHAADSRWINRPPMSWEVATRRSVSGSVEERVFSAMRRLGAARRSGDALRADATLAVLDSGNRHVLAFTRHHRRGQRLLALANFGDERQSVSDDLLRASGITSFVTVVSADGPVRVVDGRLTLDGLGYAWLAGA